MVHNDAEDVTARRAARTTADATRAAFSSSTVPTRRGWTERHLIKVVDSPSLDLQHLQESIRALVPLRWIRDPQTATTILPEKERQVVVLYQIGQTAPICSVDAGGRSMGAPFHRKQWLCGECINQPAHDWAIVVGDTIGFIGKHRQKRHGQMSAISDIHHGFGNQLRQMITQFVVGPALPHAVAGYRRGKGCVHVGIGD